MRPDDEVASVEEIEEVVEEVLGKAGIESEREVLEAVAEKMQTKLYDLREIGILDEELDERGNDE